MSGFPLFLLFRGVGGWGEYCKSCHSSLLTVTQTKHSFYHWKFLHICVMHQQESEVFVSIPVWWSVTAATWSASPVTASLNWRLICPSSTPPLCFGFTSVVVSPPPPRWTLDDCRPRLAPAVCRAFGLIPLLLGSLKTHLNGIEIIVTPNHVRLHRISSFSAMFTVRLREICNKSLPQPGNTMIDTASNESIQADGSTLFHCHLCAYTSTSRDEFNDHVNDHYEFRYVNLNE